MLRGGTGCMFLSCRVFCRGPERGEALGRFGIELPPGRPTARLSSAGAGGLSGSSGGLWQSSSACAWGLAGAAGVGSRRFAALVVGAGGEPGGERPESETSSMAGSFSP